MLIDTKVKLKLHLMGFKKQCVKSGIDPLLYYPAFCEHYGKHSSNYTMSKYDVLDMACEILIEGE